MIFDHLEARCFLCGKQEAVFDSSRRICDCIGIGRGGFPADEQSCYVTILPEPKTYSVASLPDLWHSVPTDVFALATDGLGTAGRRPPETPAPPPAAELCPRFADHLGAEHHLRCGNCVIHSSSALADTTGFGKVWVLDMGSYLWSGTLKDPRSWAIVDTALAYGLTNLAVWTAGNAGLSLAKLAHAVNRRLPPEKRLQIYTVVDHEVAPEIRMQLRLWQCEVLDVFRQDKPVLNPDEIRRLVAAHLKRFRRTLDETTYWHVTDGWDGVGLLMYRYIAAQVVRNLATALWSSEGEPEPIYIVLPVGTGDLLLGFYLGIKDCEAAGLIEPRSWQLVGVLPAGANILDNIRSRSIPAAVETERAAAPPPVTPKLLGTYTPLAPCLARLDADDNVHFITINEYDQLRAGRQILSAGIDDGIPCEPSALAAFAALPYLNGYLQPSEKRPDSGTWAYRSSKQVLVVSSGLGILNRREEELLNRALGL